MDNVDDSSLGHSDFRASCVLFLADTQAEIPVDVNSSAEPLTPLRPPSYHCKCYCCIYTHWISGGDFLPILVIVFLILHAGI